MAHSKQSYPEDISLTEAHGMITPLMQAIAAQHSRYENVELDKAFGRITAQDITSPIDVPGQDTAAVDGYAFHYDDLHATLPVIGSIRAGHPYEGTIERGKAYRIFTGAPMPDGLDTVAMQEHCTIEDNGYVHLPQGMKYNANFRPRGENVTKGQVALSKGTRIGSAEIGLAAAIGYATMPVKHKLNIAVFSMGDEVVETGTIPFEDGMIYDSNRPMLISMMQNLGHYVEDYGIIKDNLATLTEQFKIVASNNDIILCSGGSSEGDEDHTKAAIIDAGGVIDFWRLALKPGRPMVCGRIGDVPLFGVPGNPVAAFVCTRLLVGPMLDVINGGSGTLPKPLTAPAGFAKSHRKGRAEFLRARLEYDNENLQIILNGRAGAGVLSSLTGADGLVEIPADHDDVSIGDPLPFFTLQEAGL